MNQIPDTVTIPEAMELLHRSRSYVEHLMYSGRITYYKPTRRHVLINTNSLAALFNEPSD